MAFVPNVSYYYYYFDVNNTAIEFSRSLTPNSQPLNINLLQLQTPLSTSSPVKWCIAYLDSLPLTTISGRGLPLTTITGKG